MRVFVLFATIVALAQGRPEAGYIYNKPVISSAIINAHDTFGDGGVSSLISGGNLGINSVNSIGSNHGISASSFNGAIGIGSTALNGADFASSSFSSGSSSFSAGNIGLAGNSNGGGIFNRGPGTLIQKHIYVHVPPPEQEEFLPQKQISVVPPQKHYKIIFIKAPTLPTPTAPVIPLQPQIEEKTLVYVLVKRPDEQPDIHIPTALPTQPSKPEVYFIRYKAQKENSFNSGNVINSGIVNNGVVSGNSIADSGIISSSAGNIGVGDSSLGISSHGGIVGSGGHEIVSSVSSSSQSHSSSSSSINLPTSYGPPSHNGGY